MKPVPLIFHGKFNLTDLLLGHTSRVPALGIGVLVASLASLGGVAWQAWETRARVESMRVELGALRTARSETTPGAENRQALSLEQSRAWNQVVRQLNTPWPAILDALEAATPETVAVVAIEPKPHSGSVRVQVEAKALDTLLQFSDRLKEFPPFHESVLLKHEVNEQDVTRPIRLSVDARFRPRGGTAVFRTESVR